VLCNRAECGGKCFSAAVHDEYGWSDSVSNLSAKLQRESIRYKEVVELADALGYELVWQKRREK
jgi:hypothetical protein